MRFFHGGPHIVRDIDPRRLGCDGELLCASASVNVAQRYGDVITEFELAPAGIVRTSYQEWFGRSGRTSMSIAEFRESRPEVAAIIVEGDRSTFDFPADTLFLVRAEALRFVGQLEAREVRSLDDGLSTTHDIDDPDAPDWRAYVDTVLGGDDPQAEVIAPSLEQAKTVGVPRF